MNTSSTIKLIAVNCGLPRQVVWHGRSVTTGIYKEPVTGRVALRKLNLDGDRQADLSVHGGADKAVYCYPVAHYDYWKTELPGRDLPLGTFGESGPKRSASWADDRARTSATRGTAPTFVR